MALKVSPPFMAGAKPTFYGKPKPIAFYGLFKAKQRFALWHPVALEVTPHLNNLALSIIKKVVARVEINYLNMPI